MARGIVRGANRESRWFYVEYEVGVFAAFHSVGGGFPFVGEFVRWSDEAEPVTMVAAESSGSVLVDQHLHLDRAAAMALLPI